MQEYAFKSMLFFLFVSKIKSNTMLGTTSETETRDTSTQINVSETDTTEETDSIKSIKVLDFWTHNPKP